MSSPDITRHLFQPDKRYSGVVRLQGAVLLDSDENERDAIDHYGERVVINEAIGANGTPNNGFKVAGIVSVSGGSFNLDLKAGSYFLGGQRFEAPVDFNLLTQADFIDREATLPNSTTHTKFFVWLEAHEQIVSAREDTEILEAALNGVETSARQKAMTRVRILPTLRDTCQQAMDDLVASLVAQNASFDPKTLNIKGSTRLKVSFNADNPAEDLCTPRTQGGYLGADNETIRVQVTRPGFFIWGLSNASPIYRVKLGSSPAGARTKITMLTPPWDQIAQPRPGDVIEILPWAARLPNHEKIASENGIFTRVSTAFNPSDKSFTIEANEP
jgi:hypothetical protein